MATEPLIEQILTNLKRPGYELFLQFNPLVSVDHQKVTHTLTNLQLLASGLLSIWPFSEKQAQKS